MTTKKTARRRYILIGGWLLYTISLSVWWLIFGLRELESLKSISTVEGVKLVEYQQMLIVEGLSLVVSLLLGGGALCWLVWKEAKERKRIAEFFSVFSHELKTPLTSIQLQAQSLREKLTDGGGAQTAQRLFLDTQRLLVQLENALMIADERFALVMEPVELGSFIESLAASWPALKVIVEGNGTIRADKRALMALFQNIFSNAIFHGKASEMRMIISQHDKQVTCTMIDNGKGFAGNVKDLGVAFKRHYPGSGSGIGLSLVKSLAERMGGKIALSNAPEGFIISGMFRRNETNSPR